MPRKYKLKFRGGKNVSFDNGEAEIINVGEAGDKSYLLYGLLFVFIIIPLIAAAVYFSVRETCSSHEPSITCDIKTTTLKSGVFDSACGDNCNLETCCEEKICEPPDSVPTGYIGSSSNEFKSISDLATAKPLTGVTCDTSNDYIGIARAHNCDFGKNWNYTGCGKNCETGINKNKGGPRTPVPTCGEIELSHVLSTKAEQGDTCNSQYNSTTNTFCELGETGYTLSENVCIDSDMCQLPT